MTAQVVTFYSFKGGVGRSTLLANVAHELARRGERVLIWDLDLEAPGIDHFPGLEPPERPWHGGFLEWLADTPLDDLPEPSPTWPSADSLRTLTRRVYAAPAPERGSLFVLPVHGTGVDLGRAYAAVDWHSLLVVRPWHGLHLFRKVLDTLIERFDPTFVLLDSRTGITDLGAVITGFLPDCTVLVGNYSAQSTAGLRSVYVGLGQFADPSRLTELRRERPLERLLVASPVPTSPGATARGRARWLDGFPGVAPTFVEVPLVENLLYAEDVLVRSAPSSDAARAYRKVVEQLVDMRDVHQLQTLFHAAAPEAAYRFEEKVGQVLRLLGFEVSPGAKNDHGIDVVVRDRRLLSRSELAVTCKLGVARANAGWRDAYDDARRRSEKVGSKALMVVEQVGPDAPAAASAVGVELQSLRQLEEQLVDLRLYRSVVVRAFESGGLARAYVPQRFLAEGGAEVEDSLAAMLSWLLGPGSGLMLIAGEAGSGKSSLLQRLAYELAAQDDHREWPTPILIDLRDFGSGANLESVLQEHLRRAVGWHGDPEAVLYLLRAGRVVLLFDGFDELSTTASELGTEEYLRVLARPVLTSEPGRAGRVVVSCRKHFTRGDERRPPVDVSAFARRLGAETRELAPFDAEQIGQFLRNKLGSARGGAVLESLQTTPRAPMAQTPLTLELLSGNDDLLQQHGEISASRLYDQMAHDWIAVRKDSPLHAWQRKGLILRLAGELWRLPEHELHHATFASQILTTERELLGDLDPGLLDGELRTAPFLVRSRDGAYRFARREFLEYFMARFLVKCAGDGVYELTAALATERLTASCAALFAERVEQSDVEMHRKVVAALESVAGGKVAADVKDNAERLLRARAERRGEPA